MRGLFPAAAAPGMTITGTQRADQRDREDVEMNENAFRDMEMTSCSGDHAQLERHRRGRECGSRRHPRRDHLQRPAMCHSSGRRSPRLFVTSRLKLGEGERWALERMSRRASPAAQERGRETGGERVIVTDPDDVPEGERTTRNST